MPQQTTLRASCLIRPKQRSEGGAPHQIPNLTRRPLLRSEFAIGLLISEGLNLKL
jgi:hypothetical protein